MSPATLQPSADDDHRAGRLFWISAAVGWAVIAWGLRGIFQHSLDTRPANLARFVVGGALLHDLIVAPLVIVAGVLLARTVPGRARAVVQGALVVSGVVALFAYPLVRAYGLAANNPTSLPHNYAANLLIVLGVVWAVAAGLIIARLRSLPETSTRPGRDDRKVAPAVDDDIGPVSVQLGGDDHGAGSGQPLRLREPPSPEVEPGP